MFGRGSKERTRRCCRLASDSSASLALTSPLSSISSITVTVRRFLCYQYRSFLAESTKAGQDRTSRFEQLSNASRLVIGDRGRKGEEVDPDGISYVFPPLQYSQTTSYYTEIIHSDRLLFFLPSVRGAYPTRGLNPSSPPLPRNAFSHRCLFHRPLSQQ